MSSSLGARGEREGRPTDTHRYPIGTTMTHSHTHQYFIFKSELEDSQKGGWKTKKLKRARKRNPNPQSAFYRLQEYSRQRGLSQCISPESIMNQISHLPIFASHSWQNSAGFRGTWTKNRQMEEKMGGREEPRHSYVTHIPENTPFAFILRSSIYEFSRGFKSRGDGILMSCQQEDLLAPGINGAFVWVFCFLKGPSVFINLSENLQPPFPF